MKRTPLTRKKPMKRGSKPLQRSALKKRGPRTRKSGGHLFPKGVDEAYRAYVRTFPCAACVAAGTLYLYQPSLTQACHVKSRGAGGDDIGNCVPLCRYHHQQQHAIGIRSFQKRYGLDLYAIAADLGRQYQARVRASRSPREPT